MSRRSTTSSIKSYKGFKEGSYAARKGRLCLIKKIHFEMHPPSVTVQMMDNDCEVGTEFDRLQRVQSWFCSMCTAQNDDAAATKCCFCGLNRNYKEKITIIEDHNEEEKKQSGDINQHRQYQQQTKVSSPSSSSSDTIMTSKANQSRTPPETESDSSDYDQDNVLSGDHDMTSNDDVDDNEDGEYIQGQSEEETDEEPQPSVYYPRRPPLQQRYRSRRHQTPYHQHHGYSPRPAHSQKKRTQRQFPTFWPTSSWFDGFDW